MCHELNFEKARDYKEKPYRDLRKDLSSIGHGGTRTFFYMVDQYFGNDLLEPFEWIFMAPLAFSPYGGTHNEALKRKTVAQLAF